MIAPQPFMRVEVRPGAAYVLSRNSALAPGTYNCYSEAQVNELLRRIAQLEGKTK